MLPSYKILKNLLKKIIIDKEEQGYKTDELYEELKKIPNSYDAIDVFSKKLSKLELREKWQYNEPYSLEQIWNECDEGRPRGRIGDYDKELFSKKTKIAFLSSVCGCILGKPLEEFPCPTYYEIKDALIKAKQWPLKKYISEEVLEYFGRRHRSWKETVDEKIKFVASDDDITYKLIAMMLLEEYGLDFTKENMGKIWIDHLPIYTTWGPERNILLKVGVNSLVPEEKCDLDSLGDIFNPGEEQCGAMIRVDPYGYACAGNPALAAELAWRDASFTHRKTGIYGAMFVAAAISTAYVAKDWMEIFETALKFVPQKSRFYAIAADSLDRIKKASDFEEGYNSIHKTYEDYGACRIFQEIGTLMNTLKFAENISDGICKQVIQGNDTDSFGAIAGSLLGAYYGEEYFDYSWIEKFHDDIYTTMGDFNERSLSKLVDRMAHLTELVKL